MVTRQKISVRQSAKKREDLGVHGRDGRERPICKRLIRNSYGGVGKNVAMWEIITSGTRSQ